MIRIKLYSKIINAIYKDARTIPINYQYPISAFIYHTLHEGDPEFASWLHEHGKKLGYKSFKLFTFSSLHIKKLKVRGDRLEILNPEISLEIRFFLPEASKPFIMALFEQQSFTIGDKKSRADFYIERIEVLPPPDFSDTSKEYLFRALSPICISKKQLENGKSQTKYLHPNDDEYEQYFKQHLLTKYKATDPEHELFSGQLNFSLKKPGKSSLVAVKAYTPQETKIRGYRSIFSLRAPQALLELGYYAGFGEKNAVGFGCVEYREYLS